MQTLHKLLTRCLLCNLPQEYAFQHPLIRKSGGFGYLSSVRHGSRPGLLGESVTPVEGKQPPRIKKDGDFRDLVTQSTVFADNSLLIKTVIEDAATGLLIAMPRRWGKTVNLDMLKRFLEIPADNHGRIIERRGTDNYKLFSGGKIDNDILGELTLSPLEVSSVKLFDKTKALDVQGTYPVININLKDCKADDFKAIARLMRAELRTVFNDHAYLEESSKLSDYQQKLVKQYLEESDDVQIERGLKVLSQALYNHYDGKKSLDIDR